MENNWTEKLKAIMADFDETQTEKNPHSSFGAKGVKLPHLINRINQVFGFECFQMKNLEFTRLENNGKRTQFEVAMDVEFDLDGKVFVVPTIGSGINFSYTDAKKGAMTNAIKKAFSYISLGWQAYAGELDDDHTQGDKNNASRPAKEENIWEKAAPLFKAIGKNTMSLVNEYCGKPWKEMSKAEQQGMIAKVEKEITAMEVEEETGEAAPPAPADEKPAESAEAPKDLTFDDLKPLCKQVGLATGRQVNYYLKIRYDGKTTSQMTPQELLTFKGILEQMIDEGDVFDVEDLKKRVKDKENGDAETPSAPTEAPETPPAADKAPGNWAEQVKDMEIRVQELFGGDLDFIGNFKKKFNLDVEKPKPQDITAACKAVAELEDDPNLLMDYM